MTDFDQRAPLLGSEFCGPLRCDVPFFYRKEVLAYVGETYPSLFFECYAGAAGTTLTLLLKDRVQRGMLVVGDPYLGAFWREALKTDNLIRKAMEFKAKHPLQLPRPMLIGVGQRGASWSRVAKALSFTEDLTPSTVRTSAELISAEIKNFIDLHPAYKILHIHALRPGDGLAVLRALRAEIEESDGESPHNTSFVLELYPSKDQKAVVGRFLSQISERRRSGSGGLGAEDLWMFETFPAKNGIAIPMLRWAKREKEIPETPSHVSIAFDIFDPTVKILPKADFVQPVPWEVYGVVAAMTRRFSFAPGPRWITYYPPNFKGERHPAGNAFSDRLHKIQSAIIRSVARNMGGDGESWPVLCTSLLPEHIEVLQELHNLSDWVITI